MEFTSASGRTLRGTDPVSLITQYRSVFRLCMVVFPVIPAHVRQRPGLDNTHVDFPIDNPGGIACHPGPDALRCHWAVAPTRRALHVRKLLRRPAEQFFLLHAAGAPIRTVEFRICLAQVLGQFMESGVARFTFQKTMA